jgi:sugar transferase (PEP-CTERM/EpsH1 system associated)
MHVVFRFDVGGLENGIVNLINHMPADAYRHAIVALTEVTNFRQRIRRDDVEFVSLHKAPGHGVWLYPQLYALMRRMRPAIVHTRNLAALEAVVPAWAARVPVRIHGEHGRDVDDLLGNVRRYQWMRRLYRRFVDHYFALSADLAAYLVERTGVPATRVTQVYNGVDAVRFAPASENTRALSGFPFRRGDHFVVGTVGRMQAVKDQPTLARAFVQALQAQPSLRDRLRLVLVGGGPLLAECAAILDQAGVAALAWLPGELEGVPDVMRGFDCFVLPSLGEGISNTILEAMASGLPVLATAVGGNAELVQHGVTGEIVPPADPAALAEVLVRWAGDPAAVAALGGAGRQEALRRFSMGAMVAAYQNRYDRELARVGSRRRAAAAAAGADGPRSEHERV